MPQPPKQQRQLPRYSLLVNVFRQARTRILLLYILFMLIFIGLAIPIFRYFITLQVSKRVQEELQKANANFQVAYNTWEQKPGQTVGDLKMFADQFLPTQLPEDDNFLILIFDQQLYRSTPSPLPNVMQPGSPLFKRWQNVPLSRRGQWDTNDSNIDQVIYQAEPLFLDGKQQGVFIVAHTTVGERAEALATVSIFVQVSVGVLLLSFLLAWFGTGRLLRPVRELATTALAIGETDLSQRLSVQGSGELTDLARTFNAMMDRLQEAFDSQRRFINDAGHELRTPITIVRGHLELMGYSPQEQQETVELVLDELDRMGRLVNDMIALAKAERPDFLQYETIETAAFVHDLFTKAQTLADRNWQLVCYCSGTVRGDRQRLTGAVLNLLRNAAQHTQTTDTIELGCRQTAIQTQFWVKDTGTGIAPEDQQRIFERFARTADRQSDGSGLGLAIVKAVTEAHQGQIDLVSQPGGGSTFTLTLPHLPQPILRAKNR
jgi:signal transduction histidine kinase